MCVFQQKFCCMSAHKHAIAWLAGHVCGRIYKNKSAEADTEFPIRIHCFSGEIGDFGGDLVGLHHLNQENLRFFSDLQVLIPEVHKD